MFVVKSGIIKSLTVIFAKLVLVGDYWLSIYFWLIDESSYFEILLNICAGLEIKISNYCGERALSF